MKLTNGSFKGREISQMNHFELIQAMVEHERLLDAEIEKQWKKQSHSQS